MRVLIAGLGNMGLSHALAHRHHPEAEIVALVNRSDVPLPPELQSCPLFNDFDVALQATKPDLAVIATYSDSHADYACRAMEAGAHVFVEKPLATTVADARRVVACARATGRKLVVGYILRHHPSWQRLIAEARALGGPYVFRLNLNQQSTGPTWETHKSLMRTTPLVLASTALPLGERASNSSTTRGRPPAMSRPAMPPVWNVRIVSWVPGSPIDWAAITPTASAGSIIRPVASDSP